MAPVGRGEFLASTEHLFIGLAVVAEVCGLRVVLLLLTLHQVAAQVAVVVGALSPMLVMEITAHTPAQVAALL
jgi:hypothetical protein